MEVGLPMGATYTKSRMLNKMVKPIRKYALKANGMLINALKANGMLIKNRKWLDVDLQGAHELASGK